MISPEKDRYRWLITKGNAITCPLLDGTTRLRAAFDHTEALYDLHKLPPQLALNLIQTYGSQIKNFLLTASDCSEASSLRQYIIIFTLKNGLHQLSKAGAIQIAQQASFGRAAFSIAETANQNVDFEAIKSTLLEIFRDPSDAMGVREDASLTYLLTTLHETNRFRHPPPDIQEAVKRYEAPRP